MSFCRNVLFIATILITHQNLYAGNFAAEMKVFRRCDTSQFCGSGGSDGHLNRDEFYKFASKLGYSVNFDDFMQYSHGDGLVSKAEVKEFLAAHSSVASNSISINEFNQTADNSPTTKAVSLSEFDKILAEQKSDLESPETSDPTFTSKSLSDKGKINEAERQKFNSEQHEKMVEAAKVRIERQNNTEYISINVNQDNSNSEDENNGNVFLSIAGAVMDPAGEAAKTILNVGLATATNMARNFVPNTINVFSGPGGKQVETESLAKTYDFVTHDKGTQVGIAVGNTIASPTKGLSVPKAGIDAIDAITSVHDALSPRDTD